MTIEPDAIGWRPGMFSGAVQCRCGFATSNTDLYECPACEAVWRKRPTGPLCVSCNQEITPGSPAQVVLAGVAHQECPGNAAVEAVDEQTGES